MADHVPRNVGEIYEFGPFRLDATEGLLFRGDEEVALAGKTLAVLLLLIRNRTRTVLKEEFMSAVWPDTVVEESNLTDNISRLRQILDDDPKDPQYIRTLPRRGYRFLAEVSTPAGPRLVVRFPTAEGESDPVAERAVVPELQVSRRRLALIAAAAVIAASVLVYLLATREEKPIERVVRASILPPSGQAFAPYLLYYLSISPDAKWITYRLESDDLRLWVRRVDSGEARPLPGTDEATFPMWSPDSRAIAFFARGKLRKVTLDGAPPQTICAVGARPRPGDWSANGDIIFSPDSLTGLSRVSAAGGTPVALTRLDASRRETTHRAATFLPDDRHFLYYAGSHEAGVDHEQQGLFVSSLDAPSSRKRVLRARSNAAYVDGHLVYAHGGALLAQRFDLERLEVTGEPVSIAATIETDAGVFLSAFAVADDGSVVYRSAPADARRELMWLGPIGVGDGTRVGEPAPYRSVRLSPDGGRAVTAIADPETGLNDLWVYDLIARDRRRVRATKENETDPIWSPDGRRIVFTRSRAFGGDGDAFVVDADGSNERLLSQAAESAVATSWSVDGHTVLGYVWRRKENPSRFQVTRWDVRDGRATPLVEGFEPRVSPDGKWFLYTAGEPPDVSAWVARVADASNKMKISREPANALVWAGDKLLYGTLTEMRVVTVATTDDQVRILDEVSGHRWDQGIHYVDSLDGNRFLCVVQKEEAADRAITIISGFAAGKGATRRP